MIIFPELFLNNLKEILNISKSPYTVLVPQIASIHKLHYQSIVSFKPCSTKHE